MKSKRADNKFTMRAWPVARSIFDAPYVREANERTTSWINNKLDKLRSEFLAARTCASCWLDNLDDCLGSRLPVPWLCYPTCCSLVRSDAPKGASSPNQVLTHAARAAAFSATSGGRARRARRALVRAREHRRCCARPATVHAARGACLGKACLALRPGLPLRGSEPDSVWQMLVG